jgi:N4-gp56 family major capsid protein
MSVVTQTVMPPAIQQNLLAKVLSTPEARRIHLLGAMTYPMPQHSGDILRKTRYRRLETTPVPVDPAMQNPPAQLLNRDFIDVQARWYSTYLIITEQVTYVDQDPVLNRAAARLSQAYSETQDQLIRDMLEATASVQNATDGTNGEVAVVKSDLIDSKLSARNGGDNEGQAFYGMAA